MLFLVADMTQMFTSKEAAHLLRVDPKSVRRYIERGWLKAESLNGNFQISEEQVLLFNQKTNARQLLEGLAEELYVLRRHGTSSSTYQQLANHSLEAINLAIDRYEEERCSFFKALKINERTPFLLGKEVAARLKIRDYHVIDRLIEENQIKARSVYNGKKTYLILDESFKKYLGANLNEPFYTSRHVSEKTRFSVNAVDRIALKHRLGRKIVGTKNSSYLFVSEEVAFFTSISQQKH